MRQRTTVTFFPYSGQMWRPTVAAPLGCPALGSKLNATGRPLPSTEIALICSCPSATLSAHAPSLPPTVYLPGSVAEGLRSEEDRRRRDDTDEGGWKGALQHWLAPGRPASSSF